MDTHVCSRHHNHSSFVAHAQYDPTQTTAVRSSFEKELIRRWKRIIKAIHIEIVERDGFNYSKKGKWNAAFDFPSSSGKVGAFMKWIRKLEDNEILEIKKGTPMESAAKKAWQNIYIQTAYQKGVARSAAQMRKGGLKVTDRWVESSFFRPIHADRMGLIYTRVYSELDGITKAMDTKISQTLALGIADGMHPNKIAKKLAEDVKGLGISRSRRLARTEIIRTHAEATLNSFEEADMEGVELQSEFTTAGDNKVCPKCSALEGKKFTLSEARGIIPVHPNCRCAWLPVIGDGGAKELL